MKFLFNIVFFISFLALGSCSNSPIKRSIKAQDFAIKNNFKHEVVEADGFYITNFSKITDYNKPFTIYVEGDGQVISQREISSNPTPKNSMMFELASLDKSANVIYLARPCQYTSIDINPKCLSNKYWLGDRYSEEIVAAMDKAIKKISHKQPINLVGFSGGGAISVLVAARNDKVKSIITLAGNLDHIAFSDNKRKPHLYNSLNPVDYINQVKHIPQLHLSGAKDTVVPPFIAKEFISRSNSSCVHGEVLKGISHYKGWNKIWPSILNRPLTCND